MADHPLIHSTVPQAWRYWLLAMAWRQTAGISVVQPSGVTWQWLLTGGNFCLSPPHRRRRRALTPAASNQLKCA
eukprot:3287306-Rhodomonas_salina.1